MIERHLFRAVGYDEDAFGEAMSLSVDLAKQGDCGITIAVLRLAEADNDRFVLTSYFAPEVVRVMARGEPVRVSDELPSVRLTNFRSLTDDEPNVIFAVHAVESEMEAVDAIANAKAAIALSFTFDSLDAWAAKWNASVRDFPFKPPSEL